MNHDKYQDVSTSEDILEFRFISDGRRGPIPKLVQYKQVGPNVYNLGFGDEREDGTIDDIAESNNGDIRKVLATVAFTVYAFTATYPDMVVFLRGSTPQRTRVYHQAITKNWKEICETFIVEGALKLHDGSYINLPFEQNKKYDGYFIVLKQCSKGNV